MFSTIMYNNIKQTGQIDNAMSIMITSFNVRGLRNDNKRARVLWHMKDNYPCILFLQETYTTQNDETLWKNNWNGQIYMSHGTNHSKGVAILIPEDIETDIKNIDIDQEGRCIIVNGKFGGRDLTLMNLYAPTKNDINNQMNFISKLIPKINEFHENLIMGGDLNTYLNPQLDKKGGKLQNISQYASRLLEMFEEYNLIDSCCICNPDKQRYTWRENTAHGIIQSRLDYIICQHNLLYQSKNCKIGNSVYSDHNPINIELYIVDEQKRGKGLRKFNNSLLTDPKYVDKIKNKLEECEQRYKNSKDHCLIWDAIKAELRGVSISHSSYKSKQRKIELQKLNQELLECEHALGIDKQKDPDLYQQYITVKNEIEQINNHITKGIMIRAQAKFIEHNEGNTKLFLGLEKSRAKTKNITNLIADNGISIKDPNEILKEEMRFYENLYKNNLEYQGNESIEARKYFITKPDVCVSDADLQELDIELTNEEIAIALKQLPTNKSPGGDGFPVDFYKKNWPNIKKLVCNSIKGALNRGELSIEQKRAVLNLIPKKDKDIRYLKNWCPISLLNADYKIIAKALAN